MKWYLLTSFDSELVAASRVTEAFNYEGLTPTKGEGCSSTENGAHLCLVQAESMEAALPQRCTKSMMR